jgi:hypothetical protein
MERPMKPVFLTAMAVMIMCIAACDRQGGRIDLLVGDDSLRQFFSAEKGSVAMYASPEDKKAGKAECRVYEEEYDIFIKMFRVLNNREIREAYLSKGDARFAPGFIEKIRSLDEAAFRFSPESSLPLEGLRVAIDPGHSAGSMDDAIREGKFMSLVAPDGRRLRFHESALNLATAKALREMLEKDGAVVMLTREDNRQVYPVPFERWARNDFRQAVRDKLKERHISAAEADRLLGRSGERARLKFFNSEYEMPHRARLINAFHPHITVLAHLDAYDDDTGYRSKYLRIKQIMDKPGPCNDRMKDIGEVIESVAEIKRDFCTVFVPGCFLRGELGSVESRIEFLRLVISPDLDNSARYSKYVIDNFQDYLGVPAARDAFPGAFRTGIRNNGIYARNFRMTRLVHGTLCLGEPLQQNNMNEALVLAEMSEGRVPERVKNVARAYYDAIRAYVKKYCAD